MEAFDLAWKEGTCPDLIPFINAHLEGAYDKLSCDMSKISNISVKFIKQFIFIQIEIDLYSVINWKSLIKSIGMAKVLDRKSLTFEMT